VAQQLQERIREFRLRLPPTVHACKVPRPSVSQSLSVEPLGLLVGYVAGYFGKVIRVDDPVLVDYLRTQQVNRLLNRKSIYSKGNQRASQSSQNG